MSKKNAFYQTAPSLTQYCSELNTIPLLTREEEIELGRLVQAGDSEARERMITANLRLVVKIAHDFHWSSVPIDDLVSEGNIGLMEAIDRFDPENGAKLSTYAAWWIKMRMRRAIANLGRTIRVPVHVHDKIYQLRTCSLALEEELGRTPTPEELEARTGVSAKKIEELNQAAMPMVEIDAPVGSGESFDLNQTIADDIGDSPGEELIDLELRQNLSFLMQDLTEREQTILKLRFGLEGADEETLDEVGARFGLTRERIRQIQNMALERLNRAFHKLDTPNAVPVGVEKEEFSQPLAMSA